MRGFLADGPGTGGSAVDTAGVFCDSGRFHTSVPRGMSMAMALARRKSIPNTMAVARFGR